MNLIENQTDHVIGMWGSLKQRRTELCLRQLSRRPRLSTVSTTLTTLNNTNTVIFLNIPDKTTTPPSTRAAAIPALEAFTQRLARH